MRFTNKFPYTTINNINLDWIIKRVKELGETVRSYAQDIANAVALAEAAQDAADSVTSTAESAVTTAQAAEATANAIAGTANTALSTAQAANTTAQAANNTAQAAEESADNAETIAGTASANASNAVQTANTALATAEAALTIASQFDESALDEKAGSLVDTKTGAAVTFLPDRTILGVSVQAESGEATELYRTGANLLDISNAEIGTAWNGSINTARARIVVPIKRNVQYILTMNGTNSLDGVFSTLSTTVPPANISVRTFPYSFNSGENDYLVLGFNKTAITNADVDALKLQLETGFNSTDFKPYTGDTYTIQPGQFDPVQIAAIAGQLNNVWSNVGNVTVEYAADLKWYIDKEIAELQALVLENGG